MTFQITKVDEYISNKIKDKDGIKIRMPLRITFHLIITCHFLPDFFVHFSPFFIGFSSGRISGLSANLTQSSEVSRSSVAAIATPSRQRRTGSRRGRRLKLFRKTTFLVNDQELGAGNMGYQVFKRGIQNLVFCYQNCSSLL